MYLLVFSLLLIRFAHQDVNGTVLPNPNLGATVPANDITVESDQALHIVCIVNGNVSDLTFNSDGNDLSSYVTKINETAVQLYMKNLKPETRMYNCLSDNQIVASNYVSVMEKPRDMRCISYNYEWLNCSFKSVGLPKNVAYQANYELIGSRFNTRNWVTIDNVTSLNNGVHYFILDKSTKLPYRSGQSKLKILLKIHVGTKNKYDLNTTFYETKHVILGSPKKLQAITTTSDYVKIAYNLPHDFINYLIQHTIQWSCKCGNQKWTGNDSFNTTSHNIVYNVTDLPYANALCNISVYLKVAQAAYDNMWSEKATIEIRTGSKVPEVPVIFPRAFQIDETKNETYAVIYWNEIPEELKNGANFTYEIEINGTGFEKVQITDRFAIVKNFNVSAETTVSIRSKNSVGISKENAIVTIPKLKDVAIRNLTRFTQWTNSSSGTTYLSWKLDENITDKPVVFACDEWNEKTRLCQGQLELVQIFESIHENYYEVYYENSTNPKKYAVAFKNLGILWSTCSIENKTSVPEIPLSITNVGISKIGLKWTLNCQDMVVPITGYTVSYCKTIKKRHVCVGEIKNITIPADGSDGQCEIEDMELNTYYLMWVTSESVFGKEQKSKILQYYHEASFISLYLIIVASVIGVLVLGVITLFLLRFVYKKIKACYTIKVVLPPGLVTPQNKNLLPTTNSKVETISPHCNQEKISIESSRLTSKAFIQQPLIDSPKPKEEPYISTVSNAKQLYKKYPYVAREVEVAPQIDLVRANITCAYDQPPENVRVDSKPKIEKQMPYIFVHQILQNENMPPYAFVQPADRKTVTIFKSLDDEKDPLHALFNASSSDSEDDDQFNHFAQHQRYIPIEHFSNRIVEESPLLHRPIIFNPTVNNNLDCDAPA